MASPAERADDDVSALRSGTVRYTGLLWLFINAEGGVMLTDSGPLVRGWSGGRVMCRPVGICS
jgi:hypothetical protein